jgi:hypothetical protein
VNSAPVRGFYDLVFAYEGGNFDKPNAEAGTLLRAMARIGLAYKGGIMFKMQAGMGDTIFTPMYQVAGARRQVQVLPQGGGAGAGRQPDRQHPHDAAGGAGKRQLRSAGAGERLDCWPSEPLYGQIDKAQAALLQRRRSTWSRTGPTGRRCTARRSTRNCRSTLKRGVDFDQVFGISIGSLPVLCPQLLAQSPALLATSEKVQTVATQAYQVWLDKDLAQMGWTYQPAASSRC